MFDFLSSGKAYTLRCHGAGLGKRKGRHTWDPMVKIEAPASVAGDPPTVDWILASALPDSKHMRERAGLDLEDVALLSNSADETVFKGCDARRVKRFYSTAMMPPSVVELLQQLTDAKETIDDYSKAASAAKNLTGGASMKLHRLGEALCS
jgi:hypothetical protein